MNNIDLGKSFKKFAKRELTNYEEWQLARHGDILPTPYLFESEQNGEPEARRFQEWAHEQWERQLHDFDKD